MKRRTVILVGVSPKVHGALRHAFGAEGASVVDAGTAREALERIRTSPVSILVGPGRLIAGGGADLYARARRLRPTVVGLGVRDGLSMRAANAILREGVFDFVDAEPSAEEAEAAAVRVLAQSELLEALEGARGTAGAAEGYRGFVGRSLPAKRARERLGRLAGEDGPALFVGEAGTGREHAARIVHAASRRSGGRFVAVDGRDRPLEDLRGEIVGFPRRPGALELAAGGSIFIREVERLPSPIQDLLEDTLETGVFRRSGDDDRPLEARLFASAERDGRQATSEGRLPAALASRFDGGTVRLSPLRERREDLALLATHFLDAIREVNGLQDLRLSHDALAVLDRYAWPGNVRELRQAIEQAALLAEDGVIRPRDLPEAVRLAGRRPADAARGSAGRAFRDAKREVVDRFERDYLRDLLDAHAGNVTEAAAHAGMMRSALQRLLRKHGVRSSEFRRRHGTRAPEEGV